MKTNALLAPWKGDRRFTAMAARVAALKKQRLDAEAIAAAIAAEFGAPTTLAALHDESRPALVVGQVGVDIEPAALEQLRLALRLPVAVRGALMPDAHVGYALPIGGVVALHGAVAPAMVGVDIGCRMHLSIFPEPPEELSRRREALFADLKAVTALGDRPRPGRAPDHAVLADPRWQATGQLRGLRATAAAQLGTSGGGNHFVELVTGERLADDGGAEAVPARFWGLLTHGGSRAVGAAIATHYTRVAARETAARARVPRLYEWLDLAGAAGQEYWTAMEVAGAYAEANHAVIHAAFARRAGVTPLLTVQNHHNFAWRHGDTVIHRKGATPAEAGVLGIIPGSMGTASYLVAGLGNEAALWSAAHGAGRRMSRSAARQAISPRAAREWLAARDVLVEGVSPDEAPQAYKDIERVMALLIGAGLVRPLARMRPAAVIMAP
jgi:tRNA-splicing ligase RtcB (3'-phosphate/5'-hydroxy nucleic acid ligase)